VPLQRVDVGGHQSGNGVTTVTGQINVFAEHDRAGAPRTRQSLLPREILRRAPGGWHSFALADSLAIWSAELAPFTGGSGLSSLGGQHDEAMKQCYLSNCAECEFHANN